MKEPYKKGIASHLDPESCAGRRKAAGEALTGASVGWVLSSEIRLVRGADVLRSTEGNTVRIASARSETGPAESMTPCTPRNSMCENREAPWPPNPNRGGPVGEGDEL